MREILFRGKDIAGNWHYGVPLIFSENYVVIDAPHVHVKMVIPETVGQFTGKTDKNGKRIIEGDIVKGSWNTIFVVYYDEDYLQFRAKKADGYARELDYYGEIHDCEVIGNIHDNPDLFTFTKN